jgi:hypothetical protein
VRALPYAASVAGEEPPGPVRIELGLPGGTKWEHGPENSSNRIVGPAGVFCRVFVQRRDGSDLDALATDGLIAEGDDAVRTLRIARAYL